VSAWAVRGTYTSKEEAVRAHLAVKTLDTRLEEADGRWRVLVRDPGHESTEAASRHWLFRRR
jgi:hypothetical protein